MDAAETKISSEPLGTRTPRIRSSSPRQIYGENMKAIKQVENLLHQKPRTEAESKSGLKYLYELSEKEKQTRRLHTSFANWISNASAGFNYAVTLTYPESFEVKYRKRAEQMAGRFRDSYNRKFGYGSNEERKQAFDLTKAAPMVVINDGDGKNIRFHHHLALVKPAGMADADFQVNVDKCWQDCLRGAKGITDVQPMATDGWNAYLARKLEVGNQEAFDVFSSNIY
ncbi:hypothetical protein [Sapientia aquatica]|uniref:Uncharacterized protein n=1 Tax=Sapientia aquatica TaxID=1549640 RepID=A0A4R5W618_9BURK|nr:hypothetical protein [Sapientia aquatica]TDK68529.1 hypothetical protein E2I14_03030 [Sapientia aquatica]